MWHPEVLTAAAQRTLEALNRTDITKPFYLAGGTGLALHLGHRRSQDFDFFHREPFDEEALIVAAQRLSGFSVIAKAKATIHANIQGTKVSFLGYAYPVLYPLAEFQSTDVADPRDIACMKMSAIASRGNRRDFVDLYAVSRECGLDQVIGDFEKKFAQAHYSILHVLKSLIYFDDAEADPMPDMLASFSWDDVKEFFQDEVPRLMKPS
jgi:hypothetical protein